MTSCAKYRYANVPYAMLCNLRAQLVVYMIFFAHRATNPVLTSGKKGNNVSPCTQFFGIRGGKLWIYTLDNPPEVALMLAPFV